MTEEKKMVYKKYIKRNGKIFGPYYYSSYREGDKVKTTYFNVKEKYQKEVKKKRLLVIAIAFLAIITLIFFLRPSIIGFTGLTTKPLFILNPIQSYPIVGGNWTVRLNTEGTADLTIRAVGGTTWSNENNNKDLRFLEIRCGDDILDYKWVDDSVFIAGYNCDKTTYHTVRVFDKGTHILEFKFGNNIKYAYNLVGCCSMNITSMVWAVNISIKYPNGSFYLQYQAMTLSSTQADTATWHNTTWQYNYTKWCGAEGNYTANASWWEVQNATKYYSNDILENKTNSSGWVFLYNVTWDAASGAYCTATCASNNGSWADPTPGWGATTGDSGGSSWNGMCCGDDSGEYYNTSNVDSSGGVADDATNGCCDAATDCIYGGNCNASGSNALDISSDGDIEYCSSGTWYDADAGSTYCAAEGSWEDDNNWDSSGEGNIDDSTNTGMCCGDDTGEGNTIINSTYDTSLTVSDDTDSCCDTATDCVNNSNCYATGIHNVNVGDDAADDYCLNSVWYDCNDSSECNAGYTCVSNDCVDITAPESVIINTPTTGWYAANFVVNATVTDAGSGISTVRYRYENSSTNGSWTSMSNPASSYWNATFVISSVADGNYTIRINATDTVGNSNISVTVANIAIDDTYPTISITFPANNSYLDQTWINITGTASDVNNDTIYVNDTRFGSNTKTYQSWNFTNTSIAEGVYSILIRANDSANNTNSTIIVFTIDRTYPQIEYGANTLTNATWYSQNWVFVNASIIETNIHTVTFEWNGTNETFDSNYYENKTSLLDGNYTFKAYVNDSAGHENSTALRIVYLDDTYPLINFSTGTENNNTYFNRNWIYTNWTFTEINLANITAELYNTTGLVNSTIFTTPIYSINWTLADTNEQYRYNITIVDKAGNTNYTETRYLTLDITYPLIDFTAGTESNNTYFNRNWIYANWTFTEINLANITAELYNTTSLVNSTIFTTPTYSINWTLADTNEQYRYNITIVDKASNRNYTETRYLTLDTSAPQISVTYPTNNSYLNQVWINITGTASDTNNDTVYVNDTRFGSNTKTYQSWNFTNTSIAEGVYNVLVTANDSANNTNSTIIVFTIDRTYPQIDFTTGTENNNTYFNRTWIFVNVSVVETNEANITFYLYNSSRDNINTTANTTAAQRTINWTGLADGVYYYNATIIDKAPNSNSTETRKITLDTTAPSITNVTIAPSTNASIDPDVTVNVTVNVTDTNIDTVILRYKNYSVSTFANLTMQFNLSGDGYYNGSFFPNEVNGTWSYQIWANDSAGNENTSAIYNISVQYDCTWNMSYNIENASGILESTSVIGNITVNNTGDVKYYNNNCTIRFEIKHDLAREYGLEFDGAGKAPKIYFYLGAEGVLYSQGRVVNVTALFASTEKENENFIITIKDMNNRSDTAERTINGYLDSTPGGPYLKPHIDALASINQSSSANLTAYVKNNGNETATNVTFNWTLPTGFANSSGALNNNLTSLANKTAAPDNIQYYNLTITTDYNAAYGINYIYVNASCAENASGCSNRSYNISVNVKCNSNDGKCGSGCIYDSTKDNHDPDCYVAPTIVTVPVSGGGGGAPGAAEIVSEATYELIRGKDTKFSLEVKNPFKDALLRDIKMSAAGYLAQYISIEPVTLDNIPPNSAFNFTIHIVAPAYFTVGVHNLTFTISSTKEVGAARTPRIEKRYVTLIIRELGREDAVKLINLSENYIEKMRVLELCIEEAESLLKQSQEALEKSDYEKVKELGEKIKNIATAALESHDKIVELDKKLKDAESRGIGIENTRRVLNLAKAASDRCDYDLALERVKEAELTYALETKGEFNLVYFVARNTLQVFFGTLIALAFLTILLFRVKLSLINHSLLRLHEEEEILLGLMQTTQHECFVEKKLGMHEYYETILQYEDKLSKTVQKAVELESAKVNLFKLKRARLELERKRLLDLMKKTQNQYIKEKSIETRVYTSRMRSYSTRLSEIEEELATREAEGALRRDKLKKFLQFVAFLKVFQVSKEERTKHLKEKREKKALLGKLIKEKEGLRREELLKKLKLKEGEELKKRAITERATRENLEKYFLAIAAREEEKQRELARKKKKEKLKQLMLQEKLMLKGLEERRKKQKFAQIKKERLERRFLAIAEKEEERKKLEKRKKKRKLGIADILKGLGPKIKGEKLERHFLALAKKLERKAKKVSKEKK